MAAKTNPDAKWAEGKSKKEVVLKYYADKQSPDQILASCAAVGVTTTVASIKWWINDLEKGGRKKDGVVKTTTQKEGDIKHRPMIAEFKDLELNDKQHKALVHLFNFEDDHAILTPSLVDKVFPTEEDQKHMRFLSSHGCIVMSDGGTKCKITQFGVQTMRFPGMKVSGKQLKINGFSPQDGLGYNRTRSEINSGKPYVVKNSGKQLESETTNNNHSSKTDIMSTATKAAPKKSATKTAAKPAVKGPSKKEVVRKLMKEGKGKFTAGEILEKMGKLKPAVTSTLASVRWYMADINAGN